MNPWIVRATVTTKERALRTQEIKAQSQEHAAMNGQQIYKVHTCGTTKEFSATTPEQAAAMMLQDRGWTSTRSIAVIGTNKRRDFLDCELVGGVLQFTSRKALP